MIKESDLKNKPLYIGNSLTDYIVEDIIYSTEDFKLLGMKINSIKHKSQKPLVIPFKKIKSLTMDGIAIDSYKDIIFYDQIPEIEKSIKNHTQIVGIDVYSNNQHLVGTIVDSVIDNKNGRIKGFLMSEGVLTDLMDGYCLIPSNSIFEIIDGPLTLNQSLENIITDRQGGLKKLLGIDLY
ncbi:PRC-barrel domain-containing protein [Alkaliphilus serpentinus]|uniref:PRC-barrel domain-containing protein n=1 Tax=Alkaliphilus serpentinus TaxID=1482731 RepID=A0A833HN97_9FIRM|nr:PRC-barrel domain-containing protein [Alkaliphilus serpentinus]KAB3527627.1 hypothetical protein F8153_11630 [Alkaliphilus serpentinus]